MAENGIILPDSYNPLDAFLDAFARFTLNPADTLRRHDSTDDVSLKTRILQEARLFAYLEDMFFLKKAPLTDAIREAVQRKCA